MRDIIGKVGQRGFGVGGAESRFAIQERLGEGGMGVVYRALDRERNIPVALKTIRQLDPAAIYRFKQEFRALADTVHPNLVTLYELLCEEGNWFFTMELLDGVDFVRYVRGRREEAPSWDSRLTRTSGGMMTTAGYLTPVLAEGSQVEGEVPPRTAEPSRVDYARCEHGLRQLVEAVMALHRSGHLHRDIKPSNVLVTRAGRVVLLDFGIIARISLQASAALEVAGTPPYMAPEQAQGKPCEASDWYGVGALLFEALTGHAPFRGTRTQIMNFKLQVQPPAPTELDPSVPPHLSGLCWELLSIDPARRPGGPAILSRLDPGRAVVKEVAPSASLVGRGREIAVLRESLDLVRQAEGQAVFLGGLSGMGKSALVHAFLREAAQGGALVLAGRCYERESVPYKAIDSLLDSLATELSSMDQAELEKLLPPGIGVLARMFPVLRGVPAIAEAEEREQAAELEPFALRHRAFASLRELFERLGSARPTVLFIDDLHWGDLDSAPLLSELIRPPGPPVLFLASYRLEEAERSPLLCALREGDRTRRLVVGRELILGPLEAPDAMALATALGATRSQAEVIAADAGGHPYLIQELSRHAVRVQAGASGRAPGLDEMLRARVEQLSGEARALLELVAIAGKPLDPVLAEAALELAPAVALGLVRQLGAANLLRAARSGERSLVDTYHDRIRETVLGGLSGSASSGYHLRLATAMEASASPDIESMAVHFAEAGEAPRAARYALEAAHAAEQALAFERAAHLYRRAIELSRPTGGERSQLLARMGIALANAGRGLEAADACLEAAGGATEEVGFELRTRAAHALLATGHLDRGLAVLKELLAEARAPLPRTALRALVSMLWYRARLVLRGLRWRERSIDEIPGQELRRLDVLIAAGEGLATVDMIRGGCMQSRAALRALELGERSRVARLLGVEATIVASAGGRALRRASQIAGYIAAMAAESGRPDELAYSVLAHGAVDYFAGRFARGAARLAEADQMFVALPGQYTSILNNLRLVRIFCLRHGGLLGEWRRSYEAYVKEAEERGDLYAETSFRRASNLLWLVAGDPERARQDLQRTSWTPPETGYHLQHAYETSARAEIAAYTGNVRSVWDELPERFSDLEISRSFLILVQEVRAESRFLWGRGALAIARLAPERRRAYLAQAEKCARKLDGEKIGYAEAWSHLLWARLALDRGEPEIAARRWRKAIECAEACGMPQHAAAARRRLGELLGGDEGAALVAAGTAWMVAEGIVDPEKMTHCYAP